jgi:hypothetical protein
MPSCSASCCAIDEALVTGHRAATTWEGCAMAARCYGNAKIFTGTGENDCAGHPTQT